MADKAIDDLTELTTGQLADDDLIFIYDASVSVLKATQLDLVQEHVGTAFTRDLLDDPDAATARATLDAAVASAVSGCRVVASGSQSINQTSATLIEYDTKTGGFSRFDIDGEFDAVTNHRFTPQTAGYYLIIASIGMVDIDDGKYISIQIRANGTGRAVSKHYSSVADADPAISVSTILYLNGSTDYVDAVMYHDEVAARSTGAVTAENYFVAMLLK